jgi:hypothetical protein
MTIKVQIDRNAPPVARYRATDVLTNTRGTGPTATDAIRNLCWAQNIEDENRIETIIHATIRRDLCPRCAGSGVLATGPTSPMKIGILAKLRRRAQRKSPSEPIAVTACDRCNGSGIVERPR